MELKDKAVIITGASSGIGLEIAKSMAAAGARLALAARSMEKLERETADLAAVGVTTIAVPTDVTRESDCRALVRATVDAFGQIDVLINNAGYAPPASLLDTSEELWDATLNVCLKGVYLMTRAALPTMLKQGGGSIVNISSVAGKVGVANRAAYCAAKWGVHGFTEALRAEVGHQNIRAYLICPGPVATPWWTNVGSPQADEVRQHMLRPEEVAEAVHWVLTKPERIKIEEVVIKPGRNPWESSPRFKK
jgi:NADP-dependent 3-hydroxy acid dehydrogenase YdfG